MSGTQTGGPAKARGNDDKHEHLEGRVTGLERDVQHLTNAVEKTNRNLAAQGEQMREGFDKVFNMFEASDKRQQERDSSLHDRITYQERSYLSGKQTNWQVVLSGLAIALTLIGGLAGFVYLSLSPVNDNLAAHMEQEGHIPTLRTVVRLDEAEGRLTSRVERLESLVSRELHNSSSNAARLDAIQKRVDREFNKDNWRTLGDAIRDIAGDKP